MEGGNSSKKSSTGKKKHECPICHELGHHWYKCKNGNPEDIVAMESERCSPKKKLKKTATCTTETSMVVATPASGMMFPYNAAVANATHTKQKRKPSTKTCVSKRKRATTTTSTSAANTSSRSETGSNDPLSLQVVQPAPSHTVQTPRNKGAIKKKLTPKRAVVEVASPSSPASNTRSKRKFKL